MPNVGLIGAGFMAGMHADRYRQMDDVSVTAISGTTAPGEFSDEHDLDADPYDDVESLVTDSGVDFVDICTPTPTHRDHVVTAAEHGVDVMCEKPLARTLGDAEEIADAVADAGVTFSAGHVLRFFPGYADIREQVDAGAIGAPGVARARRLSPLPTWGTDDWYSDPARSGGVFFDLAIHDFDFLRWVWGDVEHVFARHAALDSGEQHGVATVRFENDAVGYVDASWAQPASRPFQSEIELAGEDGLLEYDTESAASYQSYTADADEPTTANPVEKDGYYRELEHFVESVESGTEPMVTVDEAIEALRLSLAAIESVERHEPVSLEEVSRR